MRRVIVWPLLLLLVISAGGAMVFFYGLRHFEAPGPSGKAELFLVPEGAGVSCCPACNPVLAFAARTI